jgi:hypothetical protein
MSASDAAASCYKILQYQKAIDAIALSLPGLERAAFAKSDFALPSTSSEELAFIRIVSWLYVMYRETGHATVRFLSDLFEVYGIALPTDVLEHVTAVSRLRTILQHSLDYSRSQDRRVARFCAAWFRERCGSSQPESRDEWCRCLIALTEEAESFLRGLRDCAKHVEKDPDVQELAETWHRALRRAHTRQDFTELVEEIAGDLGLADLVPSGLTDRYYVTWMERLRALAHPYSFTWEARRLIEHALLMDVLPPMPITSADLMKEFNVDPGTELMAMLLCARKISDTRELDKAQLLKLLAEEHNS